MVRLKIHKGRPVLRCVEGILTMTEHNFDRPLADDAGNVVGAMCSRCGRIIQLDGGDIPDAIKNEECEQEELCQAA